MARRRNDDLGFGSDSFLDIVANIVGILIILIVIVGLRVGQMAVEEAAETATPEPERPRLSAVVVMPLPPPARPPSELIAITDDTPAEVRTVVRDLPPPTPIDVDPSLTDAIARVEAALASLRAESVAFRRDAAAATRQADAFTRLAAEAEATNAAATRETLAANTTRDRARAAVAALERDYADALRAKAAAAEPDVEQLRHDLSPAARRVNGPELHFLVAGDSVAEVPIEALTAELRPSIGRQVNFLARSGRATGEIGPIKGFVLRYLVETGGRGVLDDLRATSGGGIRVQVAGYRITPDASLRGETADEALDADSAFRRLLDVSPRRTAVTFWVYPDGFDTFATLQRFAHRAGFTVAGRPLPEGVPITGSPNGSRSLGR